MSSTKKIIFTPARKCFWGYTVLKRYVLSEQSNGKAVVVYVATIV